MGKTTRKRERRETNYAWQARTSHTSSISLFRMYLDCLKDKALITGAVHVWLLASEGEHVPQRILYTALNNHLIDAVSLNVVSVMAENQREERPHIY